MNVVCKVIHLQVLIVLLLLLAILLHISIRRRFLGSSTLSTSSARTRTTTKLSTLNHNPALQNSFLFDFWVSSAEFEVQKQDNIYKQQQLQLNDSFEDRRVQNPKSDDPTVHYYKPFLQRNQRNSNNSSSSSSSSVSFHSKNSSFVLGCIDLVRKCMRYQNDALPPHDTKASSTQQKSMDSATTLALVDPVLKGGYRNQYMRFVALVAKALSENHTILLDSILWHEKATHNGIPFSLLFNVQHWNQHAYLPKLVSYSPEKHHQWNPKTFLFHGTCKTAIAWFEAPHRVSFTPEVKAMTLPYPGGGGRSGQPENLWDYYRRHDKYGLIIPLSEFNPYTIEKNQSSILLPELEKWILTTMKPTSIVQALVEFIQPKNQPYIALHPRVEPEMLNHGHCQQGKVKSLKVIVQQILDYSDFNDYHQLFVAVAMPQMLARQSPRVPWYETHQENLQYLQTIFKQGIVKQSQQQQQQQQQATWQVWTAGESSIQEHVHSCMVTLLSSVVNMELAVQANVFVGTRVSTWSTSVWKIRHYRGLPNYEFTPNGIQKLEGLPPPFQC